MNIKATLSSSPSLAGGTGIVQLRRLSFAFTGVMLSMLAFAAAPAFAADTGPTQAFIDCVNATPKPHTAAAAVACVPANCYTTVTTSEQSAQPACTLADGTRLPRVIFSCPGSNTSLKFRPAFSLCTAGGIVDHIELGEDVNKSTKSDDPFLKNFPYVQRMGDIDLAKSPSFRDFGAGALGVVDATSPANNKTCSDCHDLMGTLAIPAAPTPGTARLLKPIPPKVIEGTLYTNDPDVEGYGYLNVNPFDIICAGIDTSPQLAASLNLGLKAKAYNLCLALKAKAN